MLEKGKWYECACRSHVYALDASGHHVLLVDPSNVHLLRDTSWTVAPVHRSNPTKLQARAACRAPSIRKGRTLHRLAMKVKDRKRRIRALNKNLLDARAANLQSVTRSDIAILNRAGAITKLVGVRRSVPPSWLKSNCFFHASISIEGEKVHLGSFKSLEEAAAAFDAATIMLNGKDAITNQSLGLLSAKVARAKLCRRAAKAARKRVREHRGKIVMEKMEALKAARTPEEKRAILANIVGVHRVRVASYAAGHA